MSKNQFTGTATQPQFQFNKDQYCMSFLMVVAETTSTHVIRKLQFNKCECLFKNDYFNPLFSGF